MLHYSVSDTVAVHHKCVEALGYPVVFTALIGSQNYGLDDCHSDVDTYSLVLPTFEDLAFARDPVAGEFELEDGKCVYKDVRVALNLLKKASPNSTEMFASKYKYVNPKYEDVVGRYLSGRNLQYMVHCNYKHMLYACAGMAHQLTKRNMPAGKRYAHAVRLMYLVDKYTDNFGNNSSDLFEVPWAYRNGLLKAKRDLENEEKYNSECTRIAEQLDFTRDNFELDMIQKTEEVLGNKLIENFQKDLLKQYLMETSK